MNTNLAYQEEIYDEMINGQIVLMSPSPMANHVYAAGNIYRIFADYLKGKTGWCAAHARRSGCTQYCDGT